MPSTTNLGGNFSIFKKHMFLLDEPLNFFLERKNKQSITGAKRMRLKTRIDGLSFDARLKAPQAVTPSLVTVAGQTTKYEQSLSRR